MGVSGAGKTTIGRLLADRLAWRFVEGDDYHPERNIEKMKAGIPLDDEDRRPWLSKLSGVIRESIEDSDPIILACSALKRSYRQMIVVDESVRLVYLRVPEKVLLERLHSRKGHFMKENMLKSQLAALEEPDDAITVEATGSPQETVDTVLNEIGL